MSVVPVPSFAQVKQWLGTSSDSDSDVRDALATEIAAQAARCRVDPYNDSLAGALKRRVARHLAMKNVPLGVQMDDTGGMQIGSTDPEVRRLEAPYRKLVIG